MAEAFPGCWWATASAWGRWSNLLSNAVKFTPEQGFVNIDARCEEEKDGVCSLLITVRDTGIGISAEQQQKLFKPFQQAEASTTRKYGGTGLGLTISKRIVEMMGGSIWVESEPEKGSTFKFTVKVRRGPEDEPLLAGGVYEDVRILTIDDDPDIREYFKEVIQEFGLNCDVAASGEEALAFVGQHGGYTIYFVDWLMPGMDGLDVARALRAKATGPTIIIMISAGEWNVIEEEAKAAGVDKFLSKPLFPSTIFDMIDETLGTGWQRKKKARPDTTGIFTGRRALLVEDVAINQEIVVSLLSDTGITIDCADNGIDGIHMFCDNPGRYDLILMDVQMPEMDGYDATRQIREMGIPGAKEIPIIAMTANVFREDIEHCLAAGMNAHISKPIDVDEVFAVLGRYMLPHNKNEEKP